MRHSEDPGSKYKGGCYEDIRRGAFVPEVEAQVFATPEGAFSPVFESDFGFHFVKTTNIRGEVFSMCHVLMKPTVPETAMLEAAALADSVAQLITLDSLTFVQAVERFSTDEDTKNQGGRVTNPRTGGLFHGVDELDRTDFFLINELRTGEHSSATAVQGAEQQAYAIYLLDERKPAHAANPQQDYELFQMQVEADLRQAKLDKWVRRRLAETYVRLIDDFSGCDFDRQWLGETASGAQ